MRRISFKNITFSKVRKALAKLRLRFKYVTFIAKLHWHERLGNCYDGFFKCKNALSPGV